LAASAARGAVAPAAGYAAPVVNPVVNAMVNPVVNAMVNAVVNATAQAAPAAVARRIFMGRLDLGTRHSLADQTSARPETVDGRFARARRADSTAPRVQDAPTRRPPAYKTRRLDALPRTRCADSAGYWVTR
jgi:hypothetical protein